MRENIEKYINPFTDYGFKKLFGEEPNKDVLKDFLNELLRDQNESIVELTYLKNEQLGNTESDRRAIFDLYCENDKGEKFIVEMQKTKQNFFKDRTTATNKLPCLFVATSFEQAQNIASVSNQQHPCCF